MIKREYVWECKCGNIVHDSQMPEDCSKCFSVGKFDKIPDDMIEEKMAEEVLSSGFGEEDED